MRQGRGPPADCCETISRSRLNANTTVLDVL